MPEYDRVFTSDEAKTLGLLTGPIPYLVDLIGEDYAEELRREATAHVSAIWEARGEAPPILIRRARLKRKVR